MRDSLLLQIAFSFLFLLFAICPISLHASEIDLTPKENETGELVETPKQMTQKQINDLFGEDPYLGQTSYLQSPDSFSQRKKSK